jgi:hypothetical protein
MRPIRAILFSVPLLLLMLSQTGCLLAAAAAGTGAGVAYVKGKTEATLAADPIQIANATEEAMNDMDITVVSRKATTVDAEIEGRTAKDTKLHVTAKSENERTSRVYIRAGVFGDDPLQERLLTRIRDNLGLSARTTESKTSERVEPVKPVQ